MKSCSIVACLIWFIIGGLVGAGVTYHQFKCQTSGVNIKLDSNTKTGPGVTVTKTGTGQ